MKLIETTVLETTIRMRYADNADPAKATKWIDFQIPVASLKRPDERRPIGDPELEYLAELRRAALRYARDTISGEIQRLSSLASRNF